MPITEKNPARHAASRQLVVLTRGSQAERGQEHAAALTATHPGRTAKLPATRATSSRPVPWGDACSRALRPNGGVKGTVVRHRREP